MTGVLIQKGEKTHTHTHTQRMPYEDRGRAWMDAAASCGCWRLVSGTGSWEEAAVSAQILMEARSHDSLALNLQAPNLRISIC